MAEQTIEYHYFGDKEDIVELVKYLQTPEAVFLEPGFIQTLSQQKDLLDQVRAEYARNNYTAFTLESFEINPRGWDTMDGDFKERRLNLNDITNIELGAQEVETRVEICRQLEFLYQNKHTEIIQAFLKYVDLMKFASNIVFYIFIIINSLKPKECKSLLKKINGKKAITKNITDLVNSQEGIMGIIDGINKDIIRDTDLESRRLRLKHEGGSAEDSFFGSDKNDTEQYVNNISIYKEKKTDLSNAVETLTNVLESIGDTRDSLRYKVNPAGKMDNIDDESFFYFFPHTLQLREKKSFMDNNNNNNEIKTEVEDHQVEEYLLKCSELEILYLKKQEELIVLIGEISNLIEKIITFLNVLRILISHFNQKNCDKNIKKHKLYTNSIINNLGEKLDIQEQIRKGLIPVDFYPVPDTLPPHPRLSQASESSLPGFESLPSPSHLKTLYTPPRRFIIRHQQCCPTNHF